LHIMLSIMCLRRQSCKKRVGDIVKKLCVTLKFLWVGCLLVSVAPALNAQRSCYQLFYAVPAQELKAESPVIVKSAGTQVPIARAFEKEGLMYSDISIWFDRVDEKAARKRLNERLALEESKKAAPILLNWLAEFTVKNRATGSGISANQWRSLKPSQQIELLFQKGQGNFLAVVNVKAAEKLFLDGILNFDDLRPSQQAPNFLTVGDDLGSYEVRSAAGESDFVEYGRQRKLIEDHLESRVGHQHIVHAWPQSQVARSDMANQYIELLDAGTWYLFWRQMKRNPGDVSGILDHPYLGVYNRSALDRLQRAVVENKPAKFKNKFRMIGARNVKAIEKLGQGQGVLPDFEMRSGNKGEKRELIERVIVSRISSGDYSGLRSYQSYQFDASTPIEDLTRDLLSDSEVLVLKEFEERFPYMTFSSSPTAYNHFRNKVIAPLLPWENRLNLHFKQAILTKARLNFAHELVRIARVYIRKDKKLRQGAARVATHEVSELRAETIEELENARYRFASRVRLDKDFERYLQPQPQVMPDIMVENTSLLDVNEIGLGIEYSFRFSENIYSKSGAEKRLLEMAETLKKWMGGGVVEKMDDGGHGHGISLRYKLTDIQGRVWRIEWDGISRSYVDGVPTRARGGHVEVPTPKFAPKNMQDIQHLYGAARELGLDPSRHAGGAHLNVDLAPLQALEPAIGARKLANLIAYFESRREIIEFIWEHPYRRRADMPVDLSQQLVVELNQFQGDWSGLAKLLYERRYFNDYVSRKPGYTQLNATAVMAEVVPESYQKSLDIKNPEQEWFPAFGGKGKDRIEFRLFDAQVDEYMAALQIKYARALLNKAFTPANTLYLNFQYPPEIQKIWKKSPSLFWQAMQEHLLELGLNPQEFEPLFVQAIEIQQLVSKLPAPTKKIEDLAEPVVEERK